MPVNQFNESHFTLPPLKLMGPRMSIKIPEAFAFSFIPKKCSKSNCPFDEWVSGNAVFEAILKQLSTLLPYESVSDRSTPVISAPIKRYVGLADSFKPPTLGSSLQLKNTEFFIVKVY